VPDTFTLALTIALTLALTITLTLAPPEHVDDALLRLPAFLGREPVLKVSVAHLSHRGPQPSRSRRTSSNSVCNAAHCRHGRAGACVDRSSSIVTALIARATGRSAKAEVPPSRLVSLLPSSANTEAASKGHQPWARPVPGATEASATH